VWDYWTLWATYWYSCRTYWNSMKLTNRICCITCFPAWLTDTWTGAVYYEIELGCASYEQLVTLWSQ
jgi:hypothetical protein